MPIWRPDSYFRRQGAVDVDPASSGYGNLAGQVDMLRRSWFNLDLIWAIALAVTGVAALLV